MFWLSFIPLYERLYPTFVVSGQNSTDQFNKFHFHDVPNFNVTSIYEETYLSDTVAIQLLQNFFNWFTATVVWFPFMGLYNRLYPIFAPANNQRSIDDQVSISPTFHKQLFPVKVFLQLFLLTACNFLAK